jgi:hypothetical protein
VPIAKSSLLLVHLFAELIVYLSNVILSVINVSVIHQLTWSHHRNISYLWTSKYFAYNHVRNTYTYVTDNSVFINTVNKNWMIRSYVFFCYSSRTLLEVIRQMSTYYFVSISIIVDFSYGNFDNEIVHKCLDASHLLFSPNVSKFWSYWTDFCQRTHWKFVQACRFGPYGRTDGRQTEVTQLPITVHL